MAEYQTAYDKLLAHEGGYVNDPADSGGETYKGVARRHHPDWSGWSRIDRAKGQSGFPGKLEDDSVLQRQVSGFYKKHYWDRIKGDDLPDQSIAEEVFDTGVNMGMRRAARFLQESINLLDRNQAEGLVVDGKVGSKTIQALKKSLQGDQSNYFVLLLLNVFQGYRYIEVLRLNPKNERFTRGWLKRVALPQP